MKYIKALLVKFIMMTAVLWIVLGGFFGVSFGDIIATSVLLTAVAFIVGDLLVLPKLGNVTATIADFGLALAGVWILGSFLFEEPVALGTASLISAVIIAVGELFFHRYMNKQILDDQSETTEQSKGISMDKNLQTEFGSDMDIKPAAKKAENTDKEDQE